MEVSSKKPKVFLFDTESADLNAEFGTVFCTAWKELGSSEIHIVKITDFGHFKKDVTEDYYVIEESIRQLSQADVLVGWYSSRHDVPLLNSRALYHRLPTLPPIPHIDGWRVARNHLKLRSNRLDNVSHFLGVSEKTRLDGRIWRKAQAGYLEALDYIYDHCLQDVWVLEDVYNLLRPVIKDHPNINLITGEAKACPACGSIHLTRRGSRIAGASIKQRYRCDECGYWSFSKAQRQAVEIR